METVLVIIFFVVLVAFIVVTYCIACDYEKELEEAEKKRINDMINLGKGFHVCYKDRLLREKDKEFEDAETKAQAMEIANKIDLAFKDMKIKELEDEIKKLKKRKKSK